MIIIPIRCAKSSLMETYDTLSQALQTLQARGYTYDFNLVENCIDCSELQKSFQADQFEVVETYRFEGMSSTDDSSVLYAIEATDGTKGTLIDAYGVYADSLSEEMLAKFRFRR